MILRNWCSLAVAATVSPAGMLMTLTYKEQIAVGDYSHMLSGLPCIRPQPELGELGNASFLFLSPLPSGYILFFPVLKWEMESC